MPCAGSGAAGSFFVGCVRERLDAPPERADAARGRDDDRVLDAMRPRYPRGATAAGGDTRRGRGLACQTLQYPTPPSVAHTAKGATEVG